MEDDNDKELLDYEASEGGLGRTHRRAGATRKALVGSWQGHTGVRVPSRGAPTPHLRGGHEGPRIEIACRRLPRPTTTHPVLAIPTTHPGAALASLAKPGPAYGSW